MHPVLFPSSINHSFHPYFPHLPHFPHHLPHLHRSHHPSRSSASHPSTPSAHLHPSVEAYPLHSLPDAHDGRHPSSYSTSSLTFPAPPRLSAFLLSSFPTLHMALSPAIEPLTLPLASSPARSQSITLALVDQSYPRPLSPAPPLLSSSQRSHSVASVPPPLSHASLAPSTKAGMQHPQSFVPLSTFLVGRPFHYPSEDSLPSLAPPSPVPESPPSPVSDWRLRDDDDDVFDKDDGGEEDPYQPGLPRHLKAEWPLPEKKEADPPPYSHRSSPPPVTVQRLQPPVPPLPARPVSPSLMPPTLPPRPPRPLLRLAAGLGAQNVGGAGGSPRPVPSPPPSPAPSAGIHSSPSTPVLSSYAPHTPWHVFPPLPSIPALLSHDSQLPLLHRQGSSMPPLIIETVHPALDLSSAASPRPYLRLLLPPSSSSDPLHALCCRKKSQQSVWRFSVDPDRLTRAHNPAYAGSLSLVQQSEGGHGGGQQMTFELFDADDSTVGRVVVERGKKGGCRVGVELHTGYSNEVEAGRGGRLLVGGEDETTGLLVLRVEASDRSVLIREELAGEGRKGGVGGSGRQCLTLDYPLTVFVGFAIACAVECSTEAGELQRGNRRRGSREL